MSIEIDCPECGEEMKEFITRYMCRNLACKHVEYKKYTEADLKKAVDDEREACAVLGDGQVRYSYEVAEVIRARGE